MDDIPVIKVYHVWSFKAASETLQLHQSGTLPCSHTDLISQIFLPLCNYKMEELLDTIQSRISISWNDLYEFRNTLKGLRRMDNAFSQLKRSRNGYEEPSILLLHTKFSLIYGPW